MDRLSILSCETKHAINSNKYKTNALQEINDIAPKYYVLCRFRFKTISVILELQNLRMRKTPDPPLPPPRHAAVGPVCWTTNHIALHLETPEPGGS